VEVERRKSTADMVAKLEKTMNILTRFMYTMTGVALLGGMVLAGSYYYTADVSRQIDDLSVNVARTSTAMAVSEDRYSRILVQLDSISRSLEKISDSTRTHRDEIREP